MIGWENEGIDHPRRPPGTNLPSAAPCAEGPPCLQNEQGSQSTSRFRQDPGQHVARNQGLEIHKGHREAAGGGVEQMRPRRGV